MMPQRNLLQFSGNDLAIAGKSRRLPDGGVQVRLSGSQAGTEFLSYCKEGVEKTIITARRLLLAHGILLLVQNLELDEARSLLTADVVLSSTRKKHEDILNLLQQGMYIAKPHHTDGRKPLSADRVRFALQQHHLDLSHEDLDLLPEDPHAQTFSLRAQLGQLQYYPETKNTRRRMGMINDRLRQRPGQINSVSKPVWSPDRHETVEPGEFFAARIEGVRAPMHSLMLQSSHASHNVAVHGPGGDFYVFDQNTSRTPKSMRTLPFSILERRASHLLAPDDAEQDIGGMMTDYVQLHAFFERMDHLAGLDSPKRKAVYVRNKDGVREFNNSSEPSLFRVEDADPSDQKAAHVATLQSSFLPADTAYTGAGRRSPEVKLLHDAERMGLDAKGAMLTDIFPSSAALSSIVGHDVHQSGGGFQSLVFREPAKGSGVRCFSRDDYVALWQLMGHGKDIYWLNRNITRTHGKPEEKGNVLQLMQVEDRDCIAFVPTERREEFQKGMHMVCYGTARTLDKTYREFMQQLFDLLDEHHNGRPLVCHSGGGPDMSAMGIANELAREHGFLSMGHVLGIKKEPMNRHLDGTMPFRNVDRGLRQQNMAAAADIGICMPGGGGSREERGIALTDMAIRCGQFPLIVVGSDFYRHEYLQYLKEVEEGTLDDTVLDCVSLVDDPYDAAEVIHSFAHEKTMSNHIPSDLHGPRARAKEGFQVRKAERMRAWQQPQ